MSCLIQRDLLRIPYPLAVWIIAFLVERELTFFFVFMPHSLKNFAIFVTGENDMRVTSYQALHSSVLRLHLSGFRPLQREPTQRILPMVPKD